MSEKKLELDVLLNNKKIQDIVGNENAELRRRKGYKPPVCSAFLQKYSKLKETDRFKFHIDSQAGKELPNIIGNRVQIVEGAGTPDNKTVERFSKKRNIGVVFSGGPAPGGHNVIAGIFDAARSANPDTRIFGFMMGPDGIIENEAVELNEDLVNRYRNLGGFTMIKTGRTKIDTAEKMTLSRQTCKKLGLDALVIIGGDDSNTNAAFLAQEMYDDGIQVIGVPKTIDGDIQVRDRDGQVLCAMSFGFHSAARAFAQEVSNLSNDSSSDVKYWHICKVMGRVASHLALEVALQSHPNIFMIGEDLAEYIDKDRIEKAKQKDEEEVDYNAYGMTLRHLSRVICNGIVKRAAVGKNYGVAVIPEGILEFINEIQVFIIKLNTIIAEYNDTHDTDFHSEFTYLEDKLEYLHRLARRSRDDADIFSIWNTRDDDLFSDIPAFFQEGLLMERDSHGNFPFSQVETDKVLMGLVTDYLDMLTEKGLYKLGIDRRYFIKVLEKDGLDPDYYGPILFRNYEDGEYLLVRESIISLKTLNQEFVKAGAVEEKGITPPAIEKIFKASVPKFKTQLHFYGYDGRGSDPTRFDCTYTYNLGQTVFSLIAGGATGQMAAIRNLEFEFDRWEPLGIPIAPLMHLEERKGKLALVLEKSLVDINSAAFRIAAAKRTKWLAAVPGEDQYRRPGPVYIDDNRDEDRPITLSLNSFDRK